jgi:hypothetical protein
MLKTGYRIGNARFRMTMSSGLVTPTITEGLDFEEILQVAEARLGSAVSKGGNSLIFEDDQAASRPKAKGGKKVAAPHHLTVDEALVLVKANETVKVKEQLLSLMESVYPLVNLANKELRLGLDGSLIQLKERLVAMKKGT